VTLRQYLAEKEKRGFCLIKITYIYFQIWKLFHSILCLFIYIGKRI